MIINEVKAKMQMNSFFDEVYSYHVYKPLFGSSVIIFQLACSEIHFQLKKKTGEKSR